jgi:hypothetical protein
MIKRTIILQNACSLDTPTVKITSEDQDWQAAYDRWIFGKNPTSASGWKEGVYLYHKEVEAPMSPSWNASYWKSGEDICERWTKKYPCEQCGKERVKVYCFSCINIKTEALKKEQAVIDVLMQTEAEQALLKTYGELSPEMYRSFVDLYGSVNALFGQLNRFFGIFQRVLEDHGGQLHNSTGCESCVADHRKWLDKNHKDWQDKSNVNGSCRMCIERMHKELSAAPLPPTATVSKAIVVGKAAPRAVLL